MMKTGIAVAGLFAICLTAGANAQTATEKSAQCGETFKQCKAQCTANYKDDAGQRAPCVTVCSGRYAACDAGVVYDKAKPWVDDKIKKAKPWFEEQADKAKKLYDDLMKEYGSGGDSAEPQKKTKDNSI